MARGFLMGLVWGTVVSGVGVGALSVLTGPGPDAANDAEPPQAVVEDPAPAAEALGADPDVPARVDAAADTVVAEDAPDQPPAAPQPDPNRAEDEAALARAAEADPDAPGRRPPPEAAVDLPVLQTDPLAAPETPVVIGADTTPLAPPDVGAPPDTVLTAPPVRDEAAAGRGIDVTTDGPVLPAGQAAAPGLVDPEAGRDTALAPLQPPAPPLPQGDSALIVEEVAEDPSAEAAPVEEPAPDESDAVAEDDAAPPEEQDAAPEEETGPQIGRPAVSLVEREGAVTTSRLPRIGGGGGDVADADSSTNADADTDAEDEARPLARYAASAEADPAKPRVSIILIDDPTGPLGPEALAPLPFPVTFAVDPQTEGASNRAEAYRVAGFEVLAIGAMPEGAQASDVEVSLSAVLDSVPTAIGVMEAPEGGLQDSRTVTVQTAQALAASGHGLVLMPKGLNTGEQLAAREGVPSVSVFRDFDGEGQDERVIRRFLDQAAFRARQDGAVVMMGRLSADTVSALVLWGLQDRAATVSIVPVSHILLNPSEN
ncbi:divergent polysaccharide deacetylase family protein [Cognatishimia sp. F0-27]|uniref:divergent polysaccharide deacetylase family protein n=1 Tax=Cognatishimia sp. F0-27 TaxID=2816855 RepID=UPI001D0CBACB|nr:divergent polysaccharide deacetylase family protein [Cognatishimia sp. F0-27]MCC1492551.1 divergent polysaccharide deacetylase family protein [Cognatishimia sp. F0-27]